MARIPVDRTLCVVLALFLIPWAGFAASFVADIPAQSLHFRLATFDPLRDTLPAGTRLAPLSEGPFLIQFTYPLTGREKPAIEAAGGTVAGYVPDGGFVVVGPASLAVAARAMTGFRWMGLLPSHLRVAPDADATGSVVLLWTGEPTAAVNGFSSLGTRVLALGPGFAVVARPAAGARALAALPNVLWVESYLAPSPQNYNAMITDGIRQPFNASSYSTSSGALWTFNSEAQNPGFLGYTGKGAKVDVTDTGIDGTHPAFAGRLGASKSWVGGTGWVDYFGHGTHVAGSALGSGAYFAGDGGGAYGYYAGAAPGATLIAQTYNGAALNYTGMADFASASGATVSVNSWGDGSSSAQGAYTAAASSYDALTADAGSAPGAQPLLFVFAAGNGNCNCSSIFSPATAKNVMTVGATGNDLPGGTSSSDVAPFSSYGPTDDGRIKPDIVAPGEWVASANSSQDAVGGAPLPPLAGRSYVYLSGTSQSAPQVAGAAAVAAEYLRATRNVTATPALLKALLINGAQPLAGYNWPGNATGWGALDLGAALLNSSTRRVDFVPEGFRTFMSAPDVVQYNVSVDAGQELRVTLVWTDAAGSPLAAPALVNDLDLEVRDASDSVIYTGNQINTALASSVPGAGTVFDRVNNVEVVRIPNAAAGIWKVFVRAYSLPVAGPSAPQTFALAIAGAINRSYADLSVSPPGVRGTPQSIDSGSEVTVDGEVDNSGGAPATNVQVLAFSADDPLAVPLGSWTVPSLAPGERVAYSFSFVPQDGANRIIVRATTDSPDADQANNLAFLEFFVIRRQPQLSGGTDAASLPGDTSVFSLIASNRGNARDLFFLTERAGVRDPAWALTFSQTQFSLEAGEAAPFQVFVDVPATSSAGDLTAIDVGLISAANTSRSSFLTLTARAATIHLARVEVLVPAVSAAPGTTVPVGVRVTNEGNMQEAVTVTLAPAWNGSSAWAGASVPFSLSPGEARDLTLNLSNDDLGDAGYRGLARVRAMLSSDGSTFDSLFPVFLEARPCLRLGTLAPTESVGLAPITLAVPIENCGNIALAGGALAAGSSEFALSAPSSFSVGARANGTLDVQVTPLPRAPDGDQVVTVRLDSNEGITASGAFTLRHTTGIVLEKTGSSYRFDAQPGLNIFRVEARNTGGAGGLRAPEVAGVPAGWSVSVLPSQQTVEAGATVVFSILADTGGLAQPDRADLALSFFPGSSRSGEFVLSVSVARPAAAPGLGGSGTSALFPADWTPAFALGAGLLVTAAVAVAARSSRALPRVCAACGQKAPLFDIYLDPTCTHCGARLAPALAPPR